MVKDFLLFISYMTFKKEEEVGLLPRPVPGKYFVEPNDEILTLFF